MPELKTVEDYINLKPVSADVRLQYGSDKEQFGELYLPDHPTKNIPWLAIRDQIPKSSELYTDNPLSVSSCISLAGIPDLEKGVQQNICRGACEELMGGPPEIYPDRYQHGSPHHYSLSEVPHIHLLGELDPIVPLDYLQSSLQQQANHLETIPDIGHFEMVMPDTISWTYIKRSLETLRNQTKELNWMDKIGGEFDKPYMQELKQVPTSRKSRRKAYSPPASLWFNALNSMPFENLKVVILGQDPYPTAGHAHGLCFSVLPEVKPLPKSLLNINKELQSDLNIDNSHTGYLQSWADQGVLLLECGVNCRRRQCKCSSRQRLGNLYRCHYPND
ncbi:Uracil-DNA glycosylase [Nymphon striatum]|nr:Uracil-DNA glycosylase [Nymphon striatum]